MIDLLRLIVQWIAVRLAGSLVFFSTSKGQTSPKETRLGIPNHFRISPRRVAIWLLRATRIFIAFVGLLIAVGFFGDLAWLMGPDQPSTQGAARIGLLVTKATGLLVGLFVFKALRSVINTLHIRNVASNKILLPKFHSL